MLRLPIPLGSEIGDWVGVSRCGSTEFPRALGFGHLIGTGLSAKTAKCLNAISVIFEGSIFWDIYIDRVEPMMNTSDSYYGSSRNYDKHRD
jgi:hypothetical protein